MGRSEVIFFLPHLPSFLTSQPPNYQALKSLFAAESAEGAEVFKSFFGNDVIKKNINDHKILLWFKLIGDFLELVLSVVLKIMTVC
jgi:hypothetical protein